MADTANCNLTCPKCKKVWGKLKFKFDSFVKPSDVKVVAGKRQKFRSGDALACTLCGHQYTNYDLYISIHESGAFRE